ncbi:glycoside hydrolase family 5 protein [Lacrimispora sp.]|uniref:glycoside hydrolase family 5 protein n=1 Tax=Lacrimispora sp. TaxID=2719234 RepID=UPI0032E3E633
MSTNNRNTTSIMSEETGLMNETNAQKASGPSSIRNISSRDLVREIRIGWNLGNTLDATDGYGLSSETSWGNPKTNKAMIDKIKAGGFNTLRVPTTWEKHLGPAPNYTIDPAWLNRVVEVVDYGIQNKMFVILNLHHEEWHFPSYANEAAATRILTKVWAQIGERFKNYDEHLIFEGLNEPRQKGTADEWNGGNREGQEVVNRFNAAFIRTIRSSGGNNPFRHLMIPPYAATSSTNAWDNFVIPNDNKIIISIHAYTPYDFALNITGTHEWRPDNQADTGAITYLMDSIERYFISKGYPVILGEFGAMNKNNLKQRADWAYYYVKSARAKGIPCIWWDNGAVSGEGELFGLLDRNNCSFYYPDIVNAMMKGIQ